jgi:hypothetical protein
MIAQDITIGGRFAYTRHGPYYDGPGGAMAYRYQCADCTWALITVADMDLLPANADTLERHARTHGVSAPGGASGGETHAQEG